MTTVPQMIALLLFAPLFSLLASAGNIITTPVPDIIIQTKVDEKSTTDTIERIRLLFKNNLNFDPFSRTIEKPFAATMKISEVAMSDAMKKMLASIADIFEIDLVQSRFLIGFNKLAYHIDRIDSIVTPANSNPNEILAVTSAKLRRVVVSADDISFQLILVKKNHVVKPADMINDFKNHQMGFSDDTCLEEKTITLLDVKVRNPRIYSEFDTQLPIDFKARVSLKNNLDVQLEEFSFDAFRDMIQKNPAHLTLEPSPLLLENIPDVSLNYGRLKFAIKKEDIEKMLISLTPEIKKIAVQELASAIHATLGKMLLDIIFNYPIPSDLWISSSLYSGYYATRLTVTDRKNLAMEAAGSFCSVDEFKQYKAECWRVQPKDEPIRKRKPLDLLASAQAMETVLGNPKTDSVLSVSEEYINRMLAKTVDVGLWNELISGEPRFSFGPKKAFILLDEVGENSTLVIDVIYRLPKSLRIFAGGKKFIRFPMIFKVKTYLREVFTPDKTNPARLIKVPSFTVKLESIDPSKENFVKGIPELGYQSSFMVIFRKLAIRSIKKTVKNYLGKEYLNLELPSLKGLALENEKIFSDGFGRAMIVLDHL